VLGFAGITLSKFFAAELRHPVTVHDSAVK
jgi:hypothetical protein